MSDVRASGREERVIESRGRAFESRRFPIHRQRSGRRRSVIAFLSEPDAEFIHHPTAFTLRRVWAMAARRPVAVAHVRARRRRTVSHCPTRAGACGYTSPRRGATRRRHRKHWCGSRLSAVRQDAQDEWRTTSCASCASCPGQPSAESCPSIGRASRDARPRHTSPASAGRRSRVIWYGVSQRVRIPGSAVSRPTLSSLGKATPRIAADEPVVFALAKARRRGGSPPLGYRRKQGIPENQAKPGPSAPLIRLHRTAPRTAAS